MLSLILDIKWMMLWAICVLPSTDVVPYWFMFELIKTSKKSWALARQFCKASGPCCLYKLSGSKPLPQLRTWGVIPKGSRSSIHLKHAFWPAASSSNAMTTLSAYRFSFLAWSSVKAVPWVDTAVFNPALWHAITSSWPSHKMAVFLSLIFLLMNI